MFQFLFKKHAFLHNNVYIHSLTHFFFFFCAQYVSNLSKVSLTCHIYTYTYTYIYIYIHTYIHIYIHIHTHIYIHIYIYIHTHTHTYIHQKRD